MGPGLPRQLAAARTRLTAALLAVFALSHHAPSQTLSAPWQPLGPAQVSTPAYGKVSGRITSIAIDSSDSTGNTVYLGATGGGVWKSTNARAAAADVAFSPLTDNLPVFSPNAGTAAQPSLSIGALAAVNNIVLAGTGDPNNAADSFYGEGLLRSADGGLTWTLVRNADITLTPHSFVGLAFAGIAWSSTSPGTVVAALTSSAEGALVGAASPTNAVMGLFYSTDYGVTWQMSTIVDGGTYVQRPLMSGANHGGNAATSVVWNPIRKRFYAAVRYHGYYDSPDGITWTRLTAQPGTTLTTAVCPSNTDLVGSIGCPIFRGALAVEPTTGDTYALTIDAANLDQGLWRDACTLSGSACTAPVSFAQHIGGTSLQTGSGSAAIAQGSYNLSLSAVAAGPVSNPDTLVFAGSVDLYRCSLNAGCTLLRNTTNALNGCNAPAQVAPAQHAIAAWPTATQPTIFLGNDGGLWRSTDGVNQQAIPCSTDDAAHFENLNEAFSASTTGSLAMVQSLAQHPTDAATLIASMGANGTAATTATTPWTQLSSGEGGNVAIDPTNPSLWYITTAAGVSIRRCASGSACTAADFLGTPTIGPTQVSRDLSLTQTPWLLDPGLPSNLLLGTCRTWRGPAADGALWSSSNAISAMFAGSPAPACVAGNATVRSLAAGGTPVTTTAAQNAGSPVLYAGTAGTLGGGASAGGHLFVTQAANTATSSSAWTDVTSSPVTGGGSFNTSGYDISSIYVDPHDATGRTVYVTIRGFGIPQLYRSLNAGASWSNIKRNLPDVPANAVVVDPNDANTVYVGLDSGIYVTTQVNACETTNCWSVYGTGLPNAPVMALLASATLPTGNGRTGMLRAATYGRGIWQVPLLTASTPSAPAITLAPATLTFASQPVSTASAAQTITLTNSGNAPLTVSQIAISQSQLPLGPQAEFDSTDNCIAAPIAINQICTIQVRFTPAATGTRTATLTIYGNISGGQATAALTGIATAAGSVVLTPATLTFPQTSVNTASAVQNITISNTSAATVPLGTAAISGDFTIAANTCGSSLAASTGCTVSIAFTPKTSGTRSGTFTITSNNNALTAALSGSAVLPATDALSPAALTFAAQPLGTTSAAQQVTITNSGDVALTLISATTAGDFAAINSCGNSLAAHSTCAITIVFQPKSLGTAIGTLTISDQYRSQIITLSGTGVAPPGVSLSPLFGLSFPNTGVGLSSASATVTLTNNGGTTLAVSTIAITGDFVIVPGSNTCVATLAASSSCTLQIAFSPTGGGARNGTLTIASNAPNTPHTLALSGAGVDFALAPNGSTTATISSGQSATFPLLYTSGPSVAGATVALTCSGAPIYSTCKVVPATLAVDGNATTVAVTVLTGTTTATLRKNNKDGNGIAFALLLAPVAAFALRRSRVFATIALCTLIVAAGCGRGRLIPSSTITDPGNGIVTPPGSYNLTVTATGSGLKRTVNLTLNVQ